MLAEVFLHHTTTEKKATLRLESVPVVPAAGRQAAYSAALPTTEIASKWFVMLNCWSLRSRLTRKISDVATAGLVAFIERRCGTISVVAYGVGEKDGTGVG